MKFTIKGFDDSESGVYDPSILKAIFMAGGPGSGKSYVAKNVSGGHGLKFVNSDTLLELLMKRSGLNLDMTKLSEEDTVKKEAIRDIAKNITKRQQGNYVDGRLGLIIDGTGRDYAKIAKQRDELKKLGYDTYMVFVNTSLATALERNNKRARTVPEKLVVKMWEAVQDNMGKFQNLFGASNFILIDNNKPAEKDADVFKRAWKVVMKFARTKVSNPIGKQWMKDELAARRAGK